MLGRPRVGGGGWGCGTTIDQAAVRGRARRARRRPRDRRPPFRVRCRRRVDGPAGARLRPRVPVPGLRPAGERRDGPRRRVAHRRAVRRGPRRPPPLAHVVLAGARPPRTDAPMTDDARAPRLVATDLDGTLLRPDGTVSPRTAGALVRAADAGVEVVFVTARPPRWLQELASHV